MNENQKETIERLKSLAAEDETILGLILCGSLANGTETDKSDVDVIVVVTDDRFRHEQTNKNFFWGTDFDSNDFPVEVDGKIVPKRFIEEALRTGNESIRSTLFHSKMIYGDKELQESLRSFSGSINGKKLQNIRKFYALMKSARFSANVDTGNLLFVQKCIFDTVYFACRLVLAHNDILFPCVKNLHKEIENCSKIPEDFEDQMNDVLSTQSIEKLARFYKTVDKYFDQYHYDNRIRKGYVLENELFWFFGIKPYAEL